MECTKVNCPMQAGTPTNNCGENCPWRTTAKTGDLISRAAAIKQLRKKDFWGVYDEDCVVRFDDAISAIKEVPAVDAIPVEWLRKYDDAFDNVLPISSALRAWEEGRLNND